MNEFLRTCLIVCPLVFLAGFVGGVAGGAGIISLPAYLMAGIPTHLAVGTNKVVNGTGMVAATVKFLRSGKVNLKVSLIACISSVLASAWAPRSPPDCPRMSIKSSWSSPCPLWRCSWW